LLPDDVPEVVKRRRNNELLALQNEISDEENVRLIGREFEVLVEGLSKSARKEAEGTDEPPTVGRASQPVRQFLSPGNADIEHTSPAADHHPQLVGRTRCDRIVVFDGNPRLVGSLTQVHIDDCTPTTLMGSIVTREHQHAGSSLLPILA
jgi:tRNA-2-methylthio-N6-dimethylallyladenosine synthase